MAKHMEKMKLDALRDEKMRQQIRSTRLTFSPHINYISNINFILNL